MSWEPRLLTDNTVGMFSSGFKSFLEKLFEMGETRRIETTHNLNVVLYYQATRLSVSKRGFCSIKFTIVNLKGAASKRMFPPGELLSMKPKSI